MVQEAERFAKDVKEKRDKFQRLSSKRRAINYRVKNAL